MENTNILIVTNDEDAFQLWSFALRQKAIGTETAVTAAEALAKFEMHPFDLVLIDGDAELHQAIETCHHLRKQIINPILILMEQERESIQLSAYAAGADECILKPVSQHLLLAKISAWMRRSWNVPTEVLDTVSTGEFSLDTAKRILTINNGRSVKLTSLEFRLLHMLMTHPGRIMDSDSIVKRVWGHDGEGDNTMLKHVVYRLRRKIEENPGEPNHLNYISGEGYVFYT